MRLRKVRPRYLVLGGLVGLGCGIAVSELSGQGPLHDRAPPPCVLNAPCLPNRATWGYYEPKWRRWPGVPVVAPTPVDVEVPLPAVDRPRPEEEEQRAPRPITPTIPLDAAPAPEDALPPGGPGAAAPGRLEPTPAAREPEGPGLAPLPEAPLPGAPLPGGPGLNGFPAEPAPTPLNPFDGAEADASRFGDDPPPALPPSLRSSRRDRDARRSAEQGGPSSGVAAGVMRLPNPTSGGERRDHYDVQQASATVWAFGAEDIRPADPNAGRVQQAIHHEPLK